MVETPYLVDLLKGVWKCIEFFCLLVIGCRIVAGEGQNLIVFAIKQNLKKKRIVLVLVYLIFKSMFHQHSIEFLCERFTSVRLHTYVNQSDLLKTEFKRRYYFWHLNDIK